MMKNLFEFPNDDFPEEIIEALASGNGVKIERILSNGQTTPEGQWYDQSRDEWVMILRGGGTLEFDNGQRLEMRSGDSTLIEAHDRHRVIHTEKGTIWLGVHFEGKNPG